MNRYLVEHYLRHRLSDMKDAQLEAVRQDVCYVIGQWIERTERQTGEPFVKYLADHLADHVRRNPRDLPKLQRLAEMPLSGEQCTVKKIAGPTAPDNAMIEPMASLANLMMAGCGACCTLR
jgi:hypothetical protein